MTSPHSQLMIFDRCPPCFSAPTISALRGSPARLVLTLADLGDPNPALRPSAPLRSTASGSSGSLAGAQARLLFAYLVLHRMRASSHHELIEPSGPNRRALPIRPSTRSYQGFDDALGAERIEGRSEVRLVLAEDAWVDVEAAGAAVHRAESAAAREDSPSTWVAARIAQHIAVRPLIPRSGHRRGSRSAATTSKAPISVRSSLLPRRASGSAAAN